MKYSVGDIVQIRVCGINGLVVSATPDGPMIVYTVAYPDQHGLPISKPFWEHELEDPKDEGFGFGRREG